MLAIAIALKPDVLLLDEPTSYVSAIVFCGVDVIEH